MAIILLILIASHLAQGHLLSGIWPFNKLSANAQNALELGSHRAQSDWRFHSPIGHLNEDQKAKLESVVRAQSNLCRWAYAKFLLKELESCHSQETLCRVSLAATLCHFETHHRHNAIPASCQLDATEHTDVALCLNQMQEDVFSIYTSFLMEAESMCRELVVSEWRILVENLVERSVSLGEDSLSQLDKLQHASRILISQQLEAMQQSKTSFSSMRMAQEDLAKAQQTHLHQVQSQFERQRQWLEEIETRVQSFGGLVSDMVSRCDRIQGELTQLSTSLWTLFRLLCQSIETHSYMCNGWPLRRPSLPSFAWLMNAC